MKVETVPGQWINSRFILTFYIENSSKVNCKMYNGDIHTVYAKENVTKDILDRVVDTISNSKLNHHMLYQSEIIRRVGSI